jgi:RNA polymerase sigma-70 factor (ECF subfamily)
VDAVPDSDVVGRCREGDESAWAALYCRHAPAVARFLRRVLGPDPDLDDVVQRVFVEAFASIRGYRGEGKVTTWLFGIAARVAGKHVRTEVRWRRRRLALVRSHEGAEAAPDAHGGAEARESLRHVEEALGAMDVKHRQVFVMREIEGFSTEECSRALGLPEGTVQSRLFLARRIVLDALAAQGAVAARPVRLVAENGRL